MARATTSSGARQMPPCCSWRRRPMMSCSPTGCLCTSPTRRSPSWLLTPSHGCVATCNAPAPPFAGPFSPAFMFDSDPDPPFLPFHVLVSIRCRCCVPNGVATAQEAANSDMVTCRHGEGNIAGEGWRSDLLSGVLLPAERGRQARSQPHTLPEPPGLLCHFRQHRGA